MSKKRKTDMVFINALRMFLDLDPIQNSEHEFNPKRKLKKEQKLTSCCFSEHQSSTLAMIDGDREYKEVFYNRSVWVKL